MSEALYLNDPYLKEFEAEVVDVKDEKFIVLNRTAFYPQGGGQPFDTGVMKTADTTFSVVFCGKFDGKISHEVDKPGLKAGDKVHCTIDWERRHLLMRMHTTAHVISEVMHKEAGALITGNQLGTEKSRIDFSLEEYDPEKVKGYIAKANDVIAQDLPITVKVVPREEAMAMPGVSKLAKGLPESLTELRIVDIGGFDIQADGGTHVASTKEIGVIKLLKTENKGKSNRRLYFTLAE